MIVRAVLAPCCATVLLYTFKMDGKCSCGDLTYSKAHAFCEEGGGGYVFNKKVTYVNVQLTDEQVKELS